MYCSKASYWFLITFINIFSHDKTDVCGINDIEMAVKPFTKEQLNFFKFTFIVLDEFPKMLRDIFIKKPGYITLGDSVTVRNLLLTREGGKTDIPTNKSIN